MPKYITIPLETDPEDLLAEAISTLQSVFPGWQPSDGNLDYWILQATASQASELKDVASAVPDTIFRYFGDTVMGIPPVDAAPATATTTWTMVDNAGYTIQAGTQVGVRTAGDDLVPFYVQNTVVIPPGSLATTAGQVTIVAVNAGEAGTLLGSIGGPVELLDPLAFVSTITLVAPTAGGVDAESDSDYLDRLTEELTLLAPRPILPADFAILARTVPGVFRATALDGYNPFHNWLTLNAASVETDATGWVNDANATLARSVAQAADGVASLSLTAASAADMSARSAQAIAVVAGETWTALASIRANTTARSCRVSIKWYSDAGGTVLISTTDGTAANDVNTGFTSYSVTGVAPATAVSARVVIKVVAPANAEVHYADKMSLRRGSTTDWVPGGTAETGNERMITVAAVDTVGTAVSVGIKAQVQTLLDGKREVTFIVWTTDPNYTAIDVTYTVKAAAGFDTADVLARVNDALRQYLSPINWGGDFFSTGQVSQETWANTTTVRYLELAQVINNVQGVDYIVTLTQRKGADAFAAADVNLLGPIPLPTAGVMTGTVT